MVVYANQDVFARIEEDIIFCPNKGADIPEDKNKIDSLITGTLDQTIKQVLLKFNLEETLEKNFKSINTVHKKNELYSTLKYLMNLNDDENPQNLKDLKKEGFTLAILRRLANLLSHSCPSCKKLIQKAEKLES